MGQHSRAASGTGDGNRWAADLSMTWGLQLIQLSGVFLAVEPSKIIFRIPYIKCHTQKEEIILLYIGFHSIPKLDTTQLRVVTALH